MTLAEERVSRLEGAYEQVNQRLGDLSQSMESLHDEMIQRTESLRQEMIQRTESLRQEMNSRFNNLYVIIISGWVTSMIAILSVLLTILLKG